MRGDLAKWMAAVYQPPFLVLYETRTQQGIDSGEPILYGESVGLDICAVLTTSGVPFAPVTFTRDEITPSVLSSIIERIKSGHFTAIAILGRSVDTRTIALRVRKDIPEFPIFLVSPGKDMFKSEQCLRGNVFAVTDSVIENTYDESLQSFRKTYLAQFSQTKEPTSADLDPIDQYATFGSDSADIVINAALAIAPTDAWKGDQTARRNAMRDGIKATPNDRQGLISSGGFTSQNELNFVAHRQVLLADGAWHEANISTSVPTTGASGTNGTGADGPSINGPMWPLAGLLVVLIGLIVILLWQLDRIKRLDSRELSFVLFIVAGLISALVLFGILRSYGHVAGERLGIAFEFGGPSALFVAVLGTGIWMYFHPAPVGGPFSVSILLVDGSSNVIPLSGNIELFLDSDRVQFPIDRGHAVLANLPGRARNQTVAVSLNVGRKLKRGEKAQLRLTPDSEHRIYPVKGQRAID